MKHPFQALPGHAGRARPVVDLVIEGLELAPQACLLDTGTVAIRMGQHVAELAGIDLSDATGEEIVVGGLRATGHGAPVQLELRQGRLSHVWSPTAYFCEPWPFAFGLLSLSGLDPFLVTIQRLRRVVRAQAALTPAARAGRDWLRRPQPGSPPSAAEVPRRRPASTPSARDRVPPDVVRW